MEEIILSIYQHTWAIGSMNYDEVSGHAQQLSYRDKFRLAQLLIQLARMAEEEQNPEKRAPSKPTTSTDPELLVYVVERLRKLKPAKRETVLNSIGAMFQFQGGISDADKEKLFSELLKKQLLSVDSRAPRNIANTEAALRRKNLILRTCRSA